MIPDKITEADKRRDAATQAGVWIAPPKQPTRRDRKLTLIKKRKEARGGN